MRRGRLSPSRVEQAFPPAVAVTQEQPALVQPVWPVGPEFKALGAEAVARPARRPRHVADRKALHRGGEAALQLDARGEGPRLVGGPGAELGLAAACREIIVGLDRIDRSDRPLDPNLAAQRLPMKQKRRVW